MGNLQEDHEEANPAASYLEEGRQEDHVVESQAGLEVEWNHLVWARR